MELVEEIYNKVLAKPLTILNIFNEFFGEELVDMQGFKTLEEVKSYFSGDIVATESLVSTYVGNEGFILVHFPHVTVTNEHNNSVEVEHLWAKVYILDDGKMVGRFLLNRSEYTMLHLQNRYLHSHVSGIPFHNFEEFQTPCTGSGPINNTIGSLNAEYDEDLWRLFCLELSKYVTVESLTGGPYHKLENLRTNSSHEALIHFYPVKVLSDYALGRLQYNWLIAFTAYLIKNVEIPFNYMNGCYSVSDLPIDFILKVSDLFISWYNSMYDKGYVTAAREILIRDGIIAPYILSNGKLYTNSYLNNSARYMSYSGKKVCTFKGKDITVKISGTGENEVHQIYVLNSLIISYILTKILNTVNYKYGREESSEGTDSGKKVRYL